MLPDRAGGTALRWRAGRTSVPGEEDDLIGLDAVLVKESGEGASYRGGVAPVLGEGPGRDENQPRVCLLGGPVLGVEWHEVLDVGGDQRASGGGCAGEDLVVRQGNQRRICRDGQHVVALGAELLGDGVGEHFIEQQREGHWSPGEQLVFAAPGLLGRVLGGVSGGDLRVDLVRVGRPVADGSADEPQWDADVVGDQDEQAIVG